MEKKKKVKKKGTTVYFPEKVLEAINELEKQSEITGENRNTIILKCVVCGLKELYKVNFL
jgi:hypothetical protein